MAINKQINIDDSLTLLDRTTDAITIQPRADKSYQTNPQQTHYNPHSPTSGTLQSQPQQNVH